MAVVEQKQKMIPFITCEISLCQYVCELVLGVDVFDLDLGVQIDSIRQPIKSNSVGSGNMSHCRASSLYHHLDRIRNLCFATKCWTTGDLAQSPEDGRKSKVLEKKAGVPDKGFPPLSGHCVSCHALANLGCKSRLERAPLEQEGAIQDQTDALSRRCLRDLRLQRCLEKKLRALMLGTASWEGQDHMRTLSSRQVWKRWRLAPPAYEFCVQRLRWYQSIAREPARHAHLLCCWFGRTHFESHDRLIEGLRLHPEANGWLCEAINHWQICRRVGSETISSGFLHADSGTL